MGQALVPPPPGFELDVPPPEGFVLDSARTEPVAEDDSTLSRASGLLAGGAVKTGAGIVDLGVNAFRQFQASRDFSGKAQPWVSPTGDVAQEALTLAGIPQARDTPERLIEAAGGGVFGATGGIRGLIGGIMGSVASQGAKEAGLPVWAQLGAGLVVGGAPSLKGGGPSSLAPAVDDLLSAEGRTTATATLDDDVPRALRGEYKAARAPFEAAYKSIDELGGKVDVHNFDAMLRTTGTEQDLYPELGGAIKRTLNVFGKDAAATGVSVADVRKARGMLLDKARAAGPKEAKLLGDAAEALQTDLDNALMSTAARQVSSEYAEKIIGPFGRVRRGLTQQADPEDAWKALLNSGKSDIKRLAAATNEETRTVIRNRVLKDVIQREEAFAPGQAGSGAPIIRQMQAKGMDAFFTPAEWKGLTRVTGRLATNRGPLRNLSVAGTGAAVGGALGGGGGAVTGYLAGQQIARLGNSLAGRRFLEAASKMTAPQIDSALFAITTLPAVGTTAENVE